MRYTIAMAAFFLRPDGPFTTGDLVLALGMIIYAIAGDAREFLK